MLNKKQEKKEEQGLNLTIKQNKSIIKFNYEMNKNMLTFLFNLVIFKPLKDINGISQ